MSIGAVIFLGVMLLIFAVLDIFMLISLLKPGDERSQIIVWKAGSFTLLGLVGANVLTVIRQFAMAEKLMLNSLVQLEVAAIIYFIALQYYKRKHGG